MDRLKTLRQNWLVRVILSTAILVATGCQTTKQYSYPASDAPSYSANKILSATLKNGEIVTFNTTGGRYATEFQGSTLIEHIVGIDVSSNSIQLPLDRILDVRCETEVNNVGATVLTIMAAAGAGFLILLGIALGSWKG